jgi:hypothetical protein
VVLCELLCGQRPYRLPRASRAALEDAILQAEPVPPNQAVTDPRQRAALRGDLDTAAPAARRSLRWTWSRVLKSAWPRRWASSPRCMRNWPPSSWKA